MTSTPCRTRPGMRTFLLTATLAFSFQTFADEGVPPPTPEADPDDVVLTPEIVDKLSGEQLAQVIHAKAEAQNGGTVAWVASLSAFVFAALVVAGILAALVRTHRVKQETLRHALERGVPAEQLFPLKPPGEDLRRGILLCSAGAGLGLVTAILSPDKSWASIGLLPIALGAGCLLAHHVATSAARPSSAPRADAGRTETAPPPA